MRPRDSAKWKIQIWNRYSRVTLTDVKRTKFIINVILFVVALLANIFKNSMIVVLVYVQIYVHAFQFNNHLSLYENFPLPLYTRYTRSSSFRIPEDKKFSAAEVTTHDR